MRVLQRCRLECARADVREAHLIPAALQVVDQEEVVASEGVEVPVAGRHDDRRLTAPRDDAERRRGQENEHKTLHDSPTVTGPAEVPPSYGPRGQFAP